MHLTHNVRGVCFFCETYLMYPIILYHLFNDIAYITTWKKEGRSAVWLHLPIVHCGLISAATQMGFTLHHAFNNEIVLNQWLDDSRPNKIPHFASHQVGVCG